MIKELLQFFKALERLNKHESQKTDPRFLKRFGDITYSNGQFSFNREGVAKKLGITPHEVDQSFQEFSRPTRNKSYLPTQRKFSLRTDHNVGQEGQPSMFHADHHPRAKRYRSGRGQTKKQSGNDH